jgi:acylphosphatase
MLLTYSIVVSGKVQGVFFRQSTKEKANDLGLTGTVKNEEDGSVHIIATGDKVPLDELVKWCHEGPPKARVERVSVETVPLQSFSSFTITRR